MHPELFQNSSQLNVKSTTRISKVFLRMVNICASVDYLKFITLVLSKYFLFSFLWRWQLFWYITWNIIVILLNILRMRKNWIELSYDYPRQIEMDKEGQIKNRCYVVRKRFNGNTFPDSNLKNKISKHQICPYTNSSQEYVIQSLNEAFEG